MIKHGDIVLHRDPKAGTRWMRVVSIVAGFATCSWTAYHMSGSVAAYLRDPSSVKVVKTKEQRAVYHVDDLVATDLPRLPRLRTRT